MQLSEMVDIRANDGFGYRPLVDFGAWRVAIIKFDKRFEDVYTIERHFETDEVFILVEGSATLYVKDDELYPIPMEVGKVYNVKKGVWHHVVVSKDANVIVVENADTGPANTEKIQYK